MRHYTFHMHCSFTMQHTFTEKEVEQDTEGAEGDVVPTDEALEQLQQDLQDTIGESWAVDEVDADSGSLLGVDVDTSATSG